VIHGKLLVIACCFHSLFCLNAVSAVPQGLQTIWMKESHLGSMLNMLCWDNGMLPRMEGIRRLCSLALWTESARPHVWVKLADKGTSKQNSKLKRLGFAYFVYGFMHIFENLAEKEHNVKNAVGACHICPLYLVCTQLRS